MDLNTVSLALAASPEYVEELFSHYEKDPNSVPHEWWAIFEQNNFTSDEVESSHPHILASTEDSSKQSVMYHPKVKIVSGTDQRVFDLIDAYRKYGHLMADVNPISLKEIEEPWELSLEAAGFNKQDLVNLYPTCGLMQEEQAPLLEIIQALRQIYCGKIGFEYMDLQNPEIEHWLMHKIESNTLKASLSIEQKKHILQSLNRSELFESFLHVKYPGQKRFSLEGGETLIPMLAILLETGAELGMEELYIGMAHRGRLNVLTSIMNKSYATVFSEFEENYVPTLTEGSGDVKYHKGYHSQVTTSKGKKVTVFIPSNPSHLESVNPVLEGVVYAKQEIDQGSTKRVVPLLIHGDAALSGQGVVYETLQLSHLPGFATGGSFHIVINNQIGFTTIPKDGRSTPYCTDIARAFGSPVFHVNAEDPESCIYATILAIELRQRFHCDVFLDLNCYRKYGHNEADEPAFTQPAEYQLIKGKSPIRELYRDKLIQQSVVERKVAESLESDFSNSLSAELESIKVKEEAPTAAVKNSVHSILEVNIDTSVADEALQSIATHLSTLPEGFSAHKKLQSLIQDRRKALLAGADEKVLDWGTVENLAYGTLLMNNVPIRISGQDVQRGTFSHRHAVLIDQENSKPYMPLQHLDKDQAQFSIYNSPLSEYAVLAFEYGYSTVNQGLVIWEAQFGDFANGGQIIMDQYISAGEQKWGQKSAITLFLPHGYEGQGPEHSSGRIERFLSLSGNNNWTVAYPTTPAQMFHLLRRQGLSSLKKPLVVFTPKALLRSPKCLSSRSELSKGQFHTIIEEGAVDPSAITHLLLCTGKIYFDLVQALQDLKVRNTVIVRVEQLYPFDNVLFKKIVQKYPHLTSILWAQEEPENMGAWSYMLNLLYSEFQEKLPIKYVGRKPSASTAAGSYYLHKQQNQEILAELKNCTA
ncbi:MAG: 2-oxoglutarate dehydrogenase E1 component [Parachlamydiales bacterium]|jgi:2-oxoglutarate dehydrogenase E1 component